MPEILPRHRGRPVRRAPPPRSQAPSWFPIDEDLVVLAALWAAGLPETD
ncbi:hypothetical protein AAG742_08185 [Micrococcus sp. 2A]